MKYPTSYQIFAVREGGAVERCHVIPHNGSYNIAQHSWGVAVLIHQLFRDHPKRDEAIEIALFHDVPERWTGDMPSTIKHSCKTLRKDMERVERIIAKKLDIPSEYSTSTEAYSIFKICDMLDLFLWAVGESANGNQNVNDMINALENWFYAQDAKGKLPEGFIDFFNAKIRWWMRTNDRDTIGLLASLTNEVEQ